VTPGRPLSTGAAPRPSPTPPRDLPSTGGRRALASDTREEFVTRSATRVADARLRDDLDVLVAADVETRDRRLSTLAAVLSLEALPIDGEVADVWARLRVSLREVGPPGCRHAPGLRYSSSSWVAASICSGLRSLVVFTVTAPDAVIRRLTAAAVSSSGISQIA
jgi:hypothetical protein